MSPEGLRHGPGLKFSIREGLCIEHKPQPCGLVLFGTSGDLAARKILPALQGLGAQGLLPERFFVLGLGRAPVDEAALRRQAPGVKGLYYLRGDYGAAATYQDLGRRLKELSARHGTSGNVIFYLALPPDLFHPVTHKLGAAGLLDEPTRAWTRVVFEKPFGRDLTSALSLAAEIRDHLKERQVYRMDHYLGKDTVQNVLMFRFANSIFEPVWKRTYIDHVQISVLEAEGVGHRAGYYDRSGVLRDMFQNHMLQLLALVAMEPPSSFAAERVRDEKIKVFKALKPIDPAQPGRGLVLGQYSGYRSEPGVAAASAAPTYAAMRVEIENWRWEGVPFYLRSGKRLAGRAAEIAVVFKKVPHSMFRELSPDHLEANTLVFRIQPDEGVSLTIEAKKPGPKTCIGALTMDFDYAEAFGEHPPEAYQRLLLDVMLGDQTLFPREDALEETWSFIQPWLDADLPLSPYAPGSFGPAEADALLEAEGRAWRQP
ncbi:MAG: glucose-6-phosphate dehydrogenase [Elusimicrobia bacterium]|nr:glucose-6-phosphate dehydrogenase [Elusimicrobiota bacterium]